MIGTYIPMTLDDIAPQRFVEIDVANLEDKIINPDWVIEQKLDGVRAMALVSNHQVEWVTGRGGRTPLKSTAIKKELATAVLETLNGEWAFDGEFIKDTYHIFDLVYSRNDPSDYDINPENLFYERRRALKFIYYHVLNSNNVKLIPQARTEQEKRALVEACKNQNTEGVMLKRNDSVYNCGGFCSGILKAKFTKTADCIVLDRNIGGKENAKLGVYDDTANIVYVGMVSMLGKGIANVGDVLEIKYLFATEDNILYQPRVMKRRDDKLAKDCLLNQLVKTSRSVV